MSHFAKIDNNIVTEVIVADTAFINSGACYRLDTGAVIGGNTDFKMKAGATTQSHPHICITLQILQYRWNGGTLVSM